MKCQKVINLFVTLYNFFVWNNNAFHNLFLLQSILWLESKWRTDYNDSLKNSEISQLNLKLRVIYPWKIRKEISVIHVIFRKSRNKSLLIFQNHAKIYVNGETKWVKSIGNANAFLFEFIFEWVQEIDHQTVL